MSDTPITFASMDDFLFKMFNDTVSLQDIYTNATTTQQEEDPEQQQQQEYITQAYDETYHLQTKTGRPFGLEKALNCP